MINIIQGPKQVYVSGRQVLFNDALKRLYLILYGVGHIIVKNHSEYQRGNPLPPLHGLLFTIKEGLRKEGNVLFNDALNTFYLRLSGVRAEGLFYKHHPTDMIAHTCLCGALAGTRYR